MQLICIVFACCMGYLQPHIQWTDKGFGAKAGDSAGTMLGAKFTAI